MAESNAEDWAPKHKPRIRDNFPQFRILKLDDEDALVTCAGVEGRCGHGFIVNYQAFVEEMPKRGSTVRTRPCPYCFAVSRIPPEMEIIPSHEL